MKINEVIVREAEKVKGTKVTHNGQEYEWNGANWINISQGSKVAKKETQAELNAKFDQPQKPMSKPGKWPVDEPEAVQGDLPPVVMKNKQLKTLFPDSGLVSLSNTDAADIKYKGIQVNNVLLPVWLPNMKDALGANKGMYMSYNKDRYILIDRETPEGKKVATAIVRALLKEPIKPGMWTRLKDKFADLADPDDPASAGYAALNQRNLGMEPARGPISTILTKGAAKVDQAIGGAINKIKGKK